jgi:2'-5' RNA ligase
MRVKEALEALQAELRKTRAEVSWIRPENIHLTIKFLVKSRRND